ncbi:twin-arginine translocase subunit TatC [Brevibacillus fulvus]|uniref:Sec-independent protein translocase protein TatC n=1 Tax=Brevibacillus fulvus TaxID=1125967 RepID=A0A938Y4R0_9BACL|nr:twin-arginine translocase subunit TatC [Brevibacillus fulvus]MBM7591567.1 sec-independent protein translocase protein TatC [Brevibacillus fulvus]
MTLVEHLAELRRRLIWVIVLFIIALIAGVYFAGPVIEYLKHDPMAGGVPLKSFHPSDALMVYMQFAFLISLVVTVPFALFQLWGFVSPGLRENERKATVYFIPAAFLLFIVGILFGYYVVFPMVIQFMAGVTTEIGADPTYGIAQYFGFLFNMVIPFGFLFELPIIVMFLTRLRLLNPMRLAKIRRISYFLLAIVAITLTPPDFMSDVLVTIPLFILYELSVWISRVVYRKQLQEDAAWQERYETDSNKSV